MITKRGMFMVPLHGREGDMTVMFRRQFTRVWPRVEATFAAVEAHASYIDVIDHRLVVYVGDMHAAKVGNRPVVVKGTTTPVAAFETNTTVPVSVVDSAVESYVRSPVTRMPEIRATAPTPVAGCPQQSRGGRHHPRARHPVIVAVAIGPIAGCPDIANCGAGWLYIYGQSRRCDVDGHAD